jgi:hypothetical protein
MVSFQDVREEMRDTRVDPDGGHTSAWFGGSRDKLDVAKEGMGYV